MIGLRNPSPCAACPANKVLTNVNDRSLSPLSSASLPMSSFAVSSIGDIDDDKKSADSRAREAYSFDTQECLNKPLAMLAWISIASKQMNADQLSCLLMVNIIKATIWQSGASTLRVKQTKSMKLFLTYLFNDFLAKDRVNVGSTALRVALLDVQNMLQKPCEQWHPTMLDTLVKELSVLVQTNNTNGLTIKDRLHLKALVNHADNFLFQTPEFFAATESMFMKAYEKVMANEIADNNAATERKSHHDAVSISIRQHPVVPAFSSAEKAVGAVPSLAVAALVSQLQTQQTKSRLATASAFRPSGTLKRSPSLHPQTHPLALSIPE